MLTLASFLFVGDGLLASLLLKSLQKYPVLQNPNWAKSNAIVVLGGGAIKYPQTENDIVLPSITSFSRILEGARLYSSCKKTHGECTIIVSGGDSLHTGKSEAMVFHDTLVNLGIKNTDIKIEPASMNTFKNAEYTSLLLRNGQYDQVFLVTSGIHLTRALLYFANFGVNPIPAPSDYVQARILWLPLGYNFAMADFAIHEYLGVLRFHLYNFFGWNKDVASPGAV